MEIFNFLIKLKTNLDIILLIELFVADIFINN